MRKFSARWWVTPDLIQWRYMQACGDYSGGFAMFPYQSIDDGKLRWISDDGRSFGMLIPNAVRIVFDPPIEQWVCSHGVGE